MECVLKVSPISNINCKYNVLGNFKSTKVDSKHDSAAFQGGNREAAEFWGSVFGGVSLLSAARTFITTGGVAITPMVLGYKALSAEPNDLVENEVSTIGIKI